MKLTVLDRFQERAAVGYFCRVDLFDYVNDLPVDFENYFVQRGITSNRYLDMLWETLEEQLHIPLIVIVDQGDDPKPQVTEPITLSKKWKILDGLQRTYRLKIILDAAKYIDDLPDIRGMENATPKEISKLVRGQRAWLKDNKCPPALFAKMLKSKLAAPSKSLIEIIRGNKVWLEVWFGLNTDDQIKKMLLLNAGHKSVSIKHQIELLFSAYLPIFETRFPGGIIRDKEVSATTYSRKRKPKQFFFAHLVTAFESLKAGKAVATNADFAADKAHETEDFDERFMDVQRAELESFSDFLVSLDNQFSESPIAIKWLGREVVLAGLFGALGFLSKEKKTATEALSLLSVRLADFEKWIDLEEFEIARNSLDRARVNIGKKNKDAVFRATKEFMKGPATERADWITYFQEGIGK